MNSKVCKPTVSKLEMRSLSFWTLQILSLCMIIGPILSIDSIYGIHYFETLTYINRQTQVKRSAYEGVDRLDYTSFKAFNRSFDIVLKPGTDILADGFVANVVGADGEFSRINVNVNDHFSGHLLDDPMVEVDGHMEDTMISLTIFDHLDIYILEPARIYRTGVHGEEDKTWIVYRYSDTYLDGIGLGMKVNSKGNKSFCGNTPGPQKADSQNFSDLINEIIKKPRSGTRKRRFLMEDAKNTCSMMLVATYDLFHERCKRSAFTCAQLLISHANFADWVFSISDFGKYTGVRIIIKQMIIFQNSTQSRRGKPHFNEHLKIWKFSELLQTFSRSVRGYSGTYCVVFLLNAHSIGGHVLGLAYIGTTCTSLNTGFATSRTEQNTIMSSFRNRLLFVHEVGHIFGSHHDMDKPGCYSPSNRGGNYIMWPYITEGYCRHCQQFSSCSRRSIEKYLDRPYARKCFKQYKTLDQMCGNGVVDKGEECDEGFREKNIYSCCNSDCEFITGAVCSDHNSACCKNCRIAHNGFLCQGHVKGSCLGNAFCNGKSLECPAAPKYKDDTPCRNNGLCFEGQCLGYCFHRGKHNKRDFKSCMCSQDVEAGCKVCCYDDTDKENPGQCLPRGNLNLSDGRPCYIGICKRGMCMLQFGRSFHVYDLISGFDFTKGAIFMRNNIVSTVVILSLIIWIPACWIISEIDNKMRILYEDEAASNSSSSDIALAVPGQSIFFRDNTVLQLAPSGPAVVKAAALGQKEHSGRTVRLPDISTSMDDQLHDNSNRTSVDYRLKGKGTSVDQTRKSLLKRNSLKSKKSRGSRTVQINMKDMNVDSHSPMGTNIDDTHEKTLDTNWHSLNRFDNDLTSPKSDRDEHTLVVKILDEENVKGLKTQNLKAKGTSSTSLQEGDLTGHGHIRFELAEIGAGTEGNTMNNNTDPEAGYADDGTEKSGCACF